MTDVSSGVSDSAVAGLPEPRGPISERIIAALRTGSHLDPVDREAVAAADPWADDAQLALTVCQEMHYRGWRGVDPAREWDLGLLAARLALEEVFLATVERELPRVDDGTTAAGVLDSLAVECLRSNGASEHLRTRGDEDQFRDYFATRSLYHLKEADPHAWAIPRLHGPGKAAFVAVEYDEYGAGHADRVHQVIFADLLDSMGLDSGYLGYLDAAPAVALAPVTLMTSLGMRRSRLGATVGHLSATEVTSPPGSARILAGLERIGAPEAAKLFYREHVEADAVHELVMRHDVVGGLLRRDPLLEADVIFGIAALQLVEDRLDAALMAAWRSGTTLVYSPGS